MAGITAEQIMAHRDKINQVHRHLGRLYKELEILLEGMDDTIIDAARRK